MNKSDLLFYDAYEAFYQMAEISNTFRMFCQDAFGADFSQDGFSDLSQIDRILPYIPRAEHTHILDIGCGNGKMLGYLQNKTGAFIHGFDYAERAIESAKRKYIAHADFQTGIIGEIDYPENSFDLIISMDTLYFAPDMTAFVGQIKKWLKPDGVFFAGYQEGDVVPRTENIDTTLLALALRSNGMPFTVSDITAETYALLQKKRAAAFRHQAEFEQEGNSDWFDMLIGQTDCTLDDYPVFSRKMARYIFTAKKE